MSKSAGDAKATFATQSDFNYISAHSEEFERAVDGTITHRSSSTRQVSFSFRLVATVGAAAGALMVIINKLLPKSRLEVLSKASTDPVSIDIISVHKVPSSRMLGSPSMLKALTSQYNVDFQFKDQATQVAFFDTEHLSLCLAREVNSQSNTCWLALGTNDFNGGQSSVGWDVNYVASQISQSVVENGGVITPPTSHSPSFTMGQQVTLENTGYWSPTASSGTADRLGVINDRTMNVYIGLSQQNSGDAQPKPIYAAPYPVAAQPTEFQVVQNLYVWGSNTVVQGEVTASTYTKNAKFAVDSSSIQTVYISKSAANQWVFSTAKP